MRRFYFTDEEGNDVGFDHIGNIRGARKKAEELSAELNTNIYINDCATECIEDVIFSEHEYSKEDLKRK